MPTMMTRPVWRLGLLLLLLQAAFSSPLGAQDSLLTAGAHVRVSASTPPLVRRTGHVVDLSPDSLWLETDDSREKLGIPRTAVTALDVGDDHGSRLHHAGVGAMLGLFGGIAVGATAGASSSCAHCDGDMVPLGTAVGAAAGGVFGLLIGTMAGIAIPAEQWVPVTSTRASQQTGVPAALGFRVTLRIRV